MTMTNKEKYKRAFSTLHASANISLEAEDMEKRKNGKQFKKAAAACVAAAFVFGSISIAYAADIGGIQRKLTTWLYGQRQEVSISGDGKGNYTYTYTDENGQQQESGAGGIAIDEDGNEIPLSAEAVMDMVSNEVKPMLTEGSGSIIMIKNLRLRICLIRAAFAGYRSCIMAQLSISRLRAETRRKARCQAAILFKAPRICLWMMAAIRS